MKLVKVIFVFIITILLSLIFAQQYSQGCSDTIYSHFFEMMGIVYTKGIIEFMKNFSWALLILVLFLLPNCMNAIKSLIELIGVHLVNYGKATNSKTVSEPLQQDVQEQREFKETKGREIAATINPDDEERMSKYKQRRKNMETLERLIFEDIQKQNIDNFTKESKIVVDNDPVSNIENLYFDCSYRYKGQDRARRYVNTLFITGSLLLRTDRIYRYIRIMNDINKQRNNQRYIVELICLVIDDEKGYDSDAYERLQGVFSKAISKGILALKKYKLEDNKAKLIEKEGWVLDTSGENQLNLDMNED